MFKIAFLFILALVLFENKLQGQEPTSPDSLIVKEKSKSDGVLKLLFSGRPGRSFLFSLALPGAGQLYNKKYWKIPVVYAALGTGLYFVFENQKQYDRYNAAWTSRIIYKDQSTDEFVGRLSVQGLLAYKQYYDRNTQMSWLVTGILYLLNGVDAFVDAHLLKFNVTNDLSLQLGPSSGVNGGLGVGINLSYR